MKIVAGRVCMYLTMSNGDIIAILSAEMIASDELRLFSIAGG
jgi:hypothetical protein